MKHRKNEISASVHPVSRKPLSNRLSTRHTIVTGLVVAMSLLFIFSQQKKWDAVAHDKTNFPLKGKHRTVACSECHVKGVMQGTPTDCEACHWNRKQDDRYRLQLGHHCADCHTPFDWKRIILWITWDPQETVQIYSRMSRGRR